MPKIEKVYIDVDSTLSNHWVRIRNNSKQGKILPSAFTREEVMKDKPLPAAITATRAFGVIDMEVIILTARDWLGAYDITQDWLDKHSFHYNEVVVVNSAREKIKYLSGCANKNCLFIDDFMGGQEYRTPKFNVTTYCEALTIGMIVEPFRNNWPDILVRYCGPFIKKLVVK